MKITETCRCGAKFELECSEDSDSWAAYRLDAFHKDHRCITKEAPEPEMTLPQSEVVHDSYSDYEESIANEKR